MRRAFHTAVIAIVLLALAPGPTLEAQDPPPPTFRSSTSLVSVDVIVRDAAGNIVRGLTAADFTVTEDGRTQPIQTFTFQQIADSPPATIPTRSVLDGLEARVRDDLQRTVTTRATADQAAPMDAATFAGRRLLVLLFDVSSMQPEEIQRAVDSANEFVSTQMSAADLVSVVTVGTRIEVLSDFTPAGDGVREALDSLGYTQGTATPPPSASTVETDETATAGDGSGTDDTGFDEFNNDVRLRALKTLADTLAPIEQKKAILYFSAGMARSGDDNQVELRAAINAAVRANVAIYPVDSRGLQALAPGGDASRASARGTQLFSGQGVQRQFAQLAASQDTLTTLAEDTGGRAFVDSNDFGDAFARAQRDLSAYYLIGYSSPNSVRDGRFRRIQVRVSRPGLRVEARNGYYAERDFAHTNRGDREAMLDAELNAAVSATDLPLLVGTSWFRQANDRFYVPVALAVPGTALAAAAPSPAADAKQNGAKDTARDVKVSLDVRGLVRDERGRTVGRIRDTLDVPAGAAGMAGLAGRQILYQSGVILPPGMFSLKVVVRENGSGTIGSFETAVTVPQLRAAGLKVSPPVVSTQLQPAGRARSDNPLVRDGVQLLPNLTRVVGRGQSLYFYYEVYDPGLTEGAPDLRTSLAFYRGGVKVYETPVVERTAVDDGPRKAVLFQLEVPASAFTPGTYTCQVNVIDAVAGQVAFPRTSFQVR